VGWVFVERTPVRGPASQRAVRAAKKGAAQKAAPAAKASSRKQATGRKKAAAKKEPSTTRKKAGAKKEATSKKKAGTRKQAAKKQAAKKQSGSAAPRTSVTKTNEAMPFIDFVGRHPVGSTVEGEVERFSSHGAYVLVDGARGYISLKDLGDPAPTRARDVLDRGERRPFVVKAIDTPRRGIDLVLPELAGDLPPPEPPDPQGPDPAPAVTDEPARKRGLASAARSLGRKVAGRKS
jgi:hypothetical protein